MSDHQHSLDQSSARPTKPADPGDCPTCHCPIDPMAHGWLVLLDGQQIPCPTCSPPVQARRRERRLRQAAVWDVPDGMQAWTWQTLAALPTRPSAAVERAVREWQSRLVSQMLGTRAGLYLWGEFGLGKTGLAVCVLHAARAAGIPAAFLRTIDLLNTLRESYRTGSDAGDAQLKAARTTDLLVLDDLGVERPTGWVLEQLYALIEERKSNLRPTLFTSNFSLAELARAWDDALASLIEKANVGRIISRLDEYCTPVEVTGPYLRDRKDQSERNDGRKGGARA